MDFGFAMLLILDSHTSNMKLGLLSVSHNPEYTHDNFERVFVENGDGVDIEMEIYDVRSLEFPDHDEIDVGVVTGSKASVYDGDDHGFVEPLADWIRTADDVDLPCLGVCYGHQAIADALGGEIEPLSYDDVSGGVELGYRDVEHTGDPMFDGVPRGFVSFQSHGDYVSELPDGVEATATNDVCVQALRSGSLWSVQFHPEVDTDYARKLITEKELSEEVRHDALDTVTQENYEASLESRRVFENFVETYR
ncbi:type 1 glutamine amidotransferase [Halorutilales archaeon Cl-col2-1]